MVMYSTRCVIAKAYNVVVFPDHVGPVFKIIPFGYAKCFIINTLFHHSNHNSSKGGVFFDLSTIRITNFSHHTVGNVFALISISLFVKVIFDTTRLSVLTDTLTPKVYSFFIG